MKSPDPISPSPSGDRPSSAERKALVGLYDKGQYREVLRDSAGLIKRFPRHPFAYHIRGVALRRLNRNREAARLLEVAARLAPDHHGILNSLAHTYANLNRHEDAGVVLQKIIGLKPDDAEARFTLCRTLDAQGDVAGALAAGLEAVRLAPGNHEAHYCYGSALKHAGRLPGAIEHVRQAALLRLGTPPGRRAAGRKGTFDSAGNEALLWRVLALLASNGIHAFATAGTLLGLVRDGALLPFDKDMDVALPFSEMDAAARCLVMDGWREDQGSYGLINPRSFIHVETGFVVDLCGLVAEADGKAALGGFWMRDIPREWNRITEFPPVRLHKVDRPEGRVWTLVEPEAWLTALYGDWRTPDPYFDTVLCARNLRGFSLLTECFAWQRVTAMWESGQLAKALAIARACQSRQPGDPLWQQIIDQCEEALTAPGE